MLAKRKYLLLFVFFIAVLCGITFLINNSIENYTQSFVTSDLNNIPDCKTGLLLGTSKTLKSGAKNNYFYYRIDAAVELYKSGKIEFIIVSGDNSKSTYNEPLDMKKELIKNGVPDSVIHLDYAGFRTLDSVIRAREIFGQSSLVIISQEFHNERAVFIARKNNIVAFGYNAKDVTAFNGFKTNLREYFARDKVYFDLLFGVTPKFLGERRDIK